MIMVGMAARCLVFLVVLHIAVRGFINRPVGGRLGGSGRVEWHRVRVEDFSTSTSRVRSSSALRMAIFEVRAAVEPSVHLSAMPFFRAIAHRDTSATGPSCARMVAAAVD